jgi:hypothetical protein
MPRLVIQHLGEDSGLFELIGDRPVSFGRAKSSNVVLGEIPPYLGCTQSYYRPPTVIGRSSTAVSRML